MELTEFRAFVKQMNEGTFSSDDLKKLNADDLTKKHMYDYTLAHMIAEKCKKELVQELVTKLEAAGKKIADIKDKDGKTPLDWALHKKASDSPHSTHADERKTAPREEEILKILGWDGSEVNEEIENIVDGMSNIDMNKQDISVALSGDTSKEDSIEELD